MLQPPQPPSKSANGIGLGYVWVSQNVLNSGVFLNICKSRLIDIFIQEMHGFFQESPKCIIYKYLPDTFFLQYYLRKSLPDSFTRVIAKFRMSSHNLLIEKGRYTNVPRDQRICLNCNSNDIEDEYHFIFMCPKYSDLRSRFIKRFYYRNPSMFKLVQLLSAKNRKTLCNLSKFLTRALKRRSDN